MISITTENQNELSTLMAKRFTDIDKWKKEWFQNLDILEKLLWIYICDNCDQSGVFEMNFKMMSFMIGQKINLDNFKNIMVQIEKLESGKYWIKDFISFQNGTLSEASPAHKPIFELLFKHSLSDRVLNRVSNTPKVKVKVIVKEKVTEEGGLGETNQNVSEQLGIEWGKWKLYSKEHGKEIKGIMADEAGLMGLLDLVRRDEIKAIATIKHTMSNNWRTFVVPENLITPSDKPLVVKKGVKASD